MQKCIRCTQITAKDTRVKMFKTGRKKNRIEWRYFKVLKLDTLISQHEHDLVHIYFIIFRFIMIALCATVYLQLQRRERQTLIIEVTFLKTNILTDSPYSYLSILYSSMEIIFIKSSKNTGFTKWRNCHKTSMYSIANNQWNVTNFRIIAETGLLT